MSVLLNRFHQKKAAIFRRLREKVRRPVQKLVYRIDRRAVLAALDHVGLARGTTVCVHSSLGRLGYVDGGPDTLIDGLLEAIGRQGCLLMPTFPIQRSMAEHLQVGEPFDVRNTPSQNGIVTEIFRNRPGVLRSLHPTNPVAACGERAESLLEGHERSATPYGHETPYGRLAELDDAYILMLETHVQSLLHHVQERIGFPNLFLDDVREARFVDREGRARTMRTRVMRPRVPYYVAIPGARGPEPDWAILHDYSLIFPRAREREVRRLGFRFDGYPRLYRRRQELERQGLLRTTRLGRGQIGLLRAKPFVAGLEPEFRELIERFRSHYDPEKIAALELPYS